MRDAGLLPHAFHRDIHRNCGKLRPPGSGRYPGVVSTEKILRVALATPLKRLFDYLPPDGDEATGSPGSRVRVPFGRGKRIGVIADLGDSSELPTARLKRISEVLDPDPLLDTSLLALLKWAADYYEYPLGEVLATAMPKALREGKAPATGALRWCCTDAGRDADLEQLSQTRTGPGTHPGRSPTSARRRRSGRPGPARHHLACRHPGAGKEGPA